MRAGYIACITRGDDFTTYPTECAFQVSLSPPPPPYRSHRPKSGVNLCLAGLSTKIRHAGRCATEAGPMCQKKFLASPGSEPTWWDSIEKLLTMSYHDYHETSMQPIFVQLTDISFEFIYCCRKFQIQRHLKGGELPRRQRLQLYND